MTRIIFLSILINIILLILTVDNARAGFTVGSSISYFKNNEPVYKYVDKPVNGFSYGYNKHYKKLYLTTSTNRFVNWQEEKRVKKGNLIFTSKTKTEFEALQLGYRVKRFIPSVFIANAHIEKKLYYKDSFIGRSKNTVIVYGFGSSHIITRNLLGSVNIVAPNEEMFWGMILSINYLF